MQYPCLERDFAGFGGYTRLTHYPSGDTCLRSPYMSSDEWFAKRNKYLAKYIGLIVYEHNQPAWIVVADEDGIPALQEIE